MRMWLVQTKWWERELTLGIGLRMVCGGGVLWGVEVV